MSRGQEYRSKEQLEAMSDTELADYIEGNSFDYDGMSDTFRVAIVRLLRAKKDD